MTPEDLDKRLAAAREMGLELTVAGAGEDKLVVLNPGVVRPFLLLPEQFDERSVWFCGEREAVCAFVEGVMMGYRLCEREKVKP